jgi:GntR family transcriptional regulator, frlABCD operon transcriptional regulator
MTDKKSVTAESSLLLYEQVKVKIKSMIANGELVPGKRLPNEKELCETFNTSRITIRRAMKELSDEGVIEIIHGKGSFVKKVKQQLHILNLKGFTDGLSSTENNFTKEVLINEIVTADEVLKKHFKREEDFEVVKLVRIIRDGDDIFSVDYAYLPVDVFPGISSKIKENTSTFHIIHNDYGIKFKKAKKEIEVIHPSPEVSKLLGISSVESVVQIKKVIMDEQETPVHYSQYYLLADRVNFFIDIDMEE